MAMLKQELSLRSVTFTQDSESGTRTTLDLVAPWQLNDEGAPSAPGGDGRRAGQPERPERPAAGAGIRVRRAA